MPYAIFKSDGKFGVKNTLTNTVHSFHTTLAKANRQIRLLNAIDHGFKPTRKPSKRALELFC